MFMAFFKKEIYMPSVYVYLHMWRLVSSAAIDVVSSPPPLFWFIRLQPFQANKFCYEFTRSLIASTNIAFRVKSLMKCSMTKFQDHTILEENWKYITIFFKLIPCRCHTQMCSVIHFWKHLLNTSHVTFLPITSMSSNLLPFTGLSFWKLLM